MTKMNTAQKIFLIKQLPAWFVSCISDDAWLLFTLIGSHKVFLSAEFYLELNKILLFMTDLTTGFDVTASCCSPIADWTHVFFWTPLTYCLSDHSVVMAWLFSLITLQDELLSFYENAINVSGEMKHPNRKQTLGFVGALWAVSMEALNSFFLLF